MIHFGKCDSARLEVVVGPHPPIVPAVSHEAGSSDIVFPHGYPGNTSQLITFGNVIIGNEHATRSTNWILWAVGRRHCCTCWMPSERIKKGIAIFNYFLYFHIFQHFLIH